VDIPELAPTDPKDAFYFIIPASYVIFQIVVVVYASKVRKSILLASPYNVELSHIEAHQEAVRQSSSFPSQQQNITAYSYPQYSQEYNMPPPYAGYGQAQPSSLPTVYPYMFPVTSQHPGQQQTYALATAPPSNQDSDGLLHEVNLSQ